MTNLPRSAASHAPFLSTPQYVRQAAAAAAAGGDIPTNFGEGTFGREESRECCVRMTRMRCLILDRSSTEVTLHDFSTSLLSLLLLISLSHFAHISQTSLPPFKYLPLS